MVLKKFIFIFIILLLVISCDKKLKRGHLEKEDRFTLSIGNMDEELDFFARDGISFSLDSDIFMSNWTLLALRQFKHCRDNLCLNSV